jgi:hydroxymethylglutaryl-CoA lyase
MKAVQSSVEIVEVGPRDGLQAEDRVLPVATRLDLIRRCAEAGARRIEVCSFAHPKLLPQMAGAEEIAAAIDPDRTWSAIGLVLNAKGLERALATDLDEVNFVGYASDGYAGKNTGATAEARNAEAAELIASARAAGKRTSITVAVSFGDPIEGVVPIERLASIAARFAEAGVDEIAMGDTAGVGTPTDVAERLGAVRAATGGTPLRLHFHNTHNTGYANVVAALHAGVDALDASVGGFGGSPFSPGAGGNVATEDVAWMLDRMGVATGLDAVSLADTGAWIAAELGHDGAEAMLDRAGPWPPAP